MVDAFTNESNYTVWNDVSTNLGKLALLLQYTDFSASFKLFLRQLYKPVADRLGWDPKDGESEYVRTYITVHVRVYGLETLAMLLMTHLRDMIRLIRLTFKPYNFTSNIFQGFLFTYFKIFRV